MINQIKEYFSRAREIRELKKECGEWREKYYYQCLKTSRARVYAVGENERMKKDIQHLTEAMQAKDFIIEKLENNQTNNRGE